MNCLARPPVAPAFARRLVLLVLATPLPVFAAATESPARPQDLAVDAEQPVAADQSMAAEPPTADRAVPADLYQEGNRLYQEGDFEGAAAQYEAVLAASMESAALHYNLGNAHFRLGRLADAVVAYERAARLDPGADDARANLALVAERLQDRIEPLPRFWLLAAFDWWMRLLPRGVLDAAAGASYALLGAALVLLVLRRPRRRRAAVRRSACAFAVAFVVLGATLLARETGFGRADEAVVLAAEVRVLSAPSTEGGLTVFTLHEGTKVRIDRRSGDWAEVVLADGKVGWLELDALEVL